MAIAIEIVEGVHLALFLTRFCRSQSLGDRHKFVGPAMEYGDRHVDLVGPIHRRPRAVLLRGTVFIVGPHLREPALMARRNAKS